MIAVGQRVEGVEAIGRVLRVRTDAGQDLRPHAFDGGLLEQRLDQRLPQERDRLVAVLGQEPGGDRQRVLIRLEPEGGRKVLAGLGEGLRVHLSRAFLEQRHHQIGGPALPGRSSEVPPRNRISMAAKGMECSSTSQASSRRGR